MMMMMMMAPDQALSDGHNRLPLLESPAASTDVYFREEACPHWSLQTGTPTSICTPLSKKDYFMLPHSKIYKGEASIIRQAEGANK